MVSEMLWSNSQDTSDNFFPIAIEWWFVHHLPKLFCDISVPWCWFTPQNPHFSRILISLTLLNSLSQPLENDKNGRNASPSVLKPVSTSDWENRRKSLVKLCAALKKIQKILRVSFGSRHKNLELSNRKQKKHICYCDSFSRKYLCSREEFHQN